MAGEGGTANDLTVAEVAALIRKLLAAIDAGEMSCSPAYRHRLQGAVLALEALADCAAPDPPL